MAKKFETLNGKWISTDTEPERNLINLDLYSKIYQTSEFNDENFIYLIVFNKESSDGEFCFEYDNPEEWNTDFEELKNILKND